MKRTLILIVLVLLVFPGQSQITYRYESKLKGNVKQIRTYWDNKVFASPIFIRDYCNGLLTVETQLRDSFLQSLHHYFYDSDGNIQKEEYYSELWPPGPPGNFNQKFYHYEMGKLVMEESVSNGVPYMTVTYRYDVIGRRIEETCNYLKEVKNTITTFEYTGNNKYPFTELYWLEDKKLSKHKNAKVYDGKRTVIFDTIGRLLEEKFDSLMVTSREVTIMHWDTCTDTLGQPFTARKTWKYKGEELVEETEYDSANAVISNTVYEYEDYDEHGNWRTKKEYCTLKASTCGTRITTTMRKIEYD